MVSVWGAGCGDVGLVLESGEGGGGERLVTLPVVTSASLRWEPEGWVLGMYFNSSAGVWLCIMGVRTIIYPICDHIVTGDRSPLTMLQLPL